MDFLLRRPEQEASPIAQQTLNTYYQPSTSDVLSAFTEESFRGIGTLESDLTALEIGKQERSGTPMTEEQYRESPYYRSAVKYYRDMTEASAKTLADYSDEREENAFIISKASGAQTAAGYVAGFGAGIFEPKNIATGLAVS